MKNFNFFITRQVTNLPDGRVDLRMTILELHKVRINPMGQKDYLVFLTSDVMLASYGFCLESHFESTVLLLHYA